MNPDYKMVRMRDLPFVDFDGPRTQHIKSFVNYLLNDEKNFVPQMLRSYFSRMLDKPVLLNHLNEIVFNQGLIDSDSDLRTWSTFFADGQLLSTSIDAGDMKELLLLARGVDSVNIAGVLDCTDPWLLSWACKTQVSIHDLSKDYSSLHQKHRYDIKKSPKPDQIKVMTFEDMDKIMPLMAIGWSYCHKGSIGESNGFQQAIIWRWVQAGIGTNSLILGLYVKGTLVSVVGAYKGSEEIWQYTALWQPLQVLSLDPEHTGNYGISSIDCLIKCLKGAGHTGKLLLTIPSLTGKNQIEPYEAYKRKFEHDTMPVYSWFARNGQAGLPCFNLETQQVLLAPQEEL